MNKHIIPILVILLFLSSSFLGISYSIDDIEQSTMPILYDGDILYVGGNGTGNYSKIQDAINAAWYGDTVFVYDDSSPYYENLQIKRGINLIGEDKDTTVIDGDKQDSVIEILNDDVTVSGFTIQNCPLGDTFQYAVVKINNCQNVTISDNIISIGGESITHLFTAAIFLNGSDCSVLGNYIFEEYENQKTTGIVLYAGSSNNLISGNTIVGDYTRGISIGSYSYDSSDNIISNNNIQKCMTGIDIHGSQHEIINNEIRNTSYKGIEVTGDDNIISDNIVTGNTGPGEFSCGIDVEGYNNLISNNIISNNKHVGISVWDAKNDIIDNHISDNEVVGIYVRFGKNNLIKGNNIINNEYNAYFEYMLLGIIGNRWRENYWSDYTPNGNIPKIIRGDLYILFIGPFRWFNFDWNPAQEPYDIEV